MNPRCALHSILTIARESIIVGIRRTQQTRELREFRNFINYNMLKLCIEIIY